MTKLDEAIIAAAEAYFQEPCDDLDEEIADNFCAAIQAAVKLLVPEERPATQLDGLNIHASGHNACRAEILKNAGVG